ncbi:Cytochrome P450 [Macleaya cordata]|uniref:Cytochrome P450 n=1 Tax=Macleaya cordata TaxID=56857 RepID=A0A200QB08_MACCD|nr:Cytochrome P450 [Macleaya cordata]
MISKISGWSWWWKDGSNGEGEVVVSVLVAVLVVASWYIIRRSRRNGMLPPGPRSFLKLQLDATFANRDPPIAASVLSYGAIDIVWNSNNPEWRMLRKISIHELFSNKNLDSCYDHCRQEVRKIVRDLYYKIDAPINICEQVFLTALIVIMGMLWGGKLEGEERTSVGAEFRQLFDEMVELMERPNVSDLFPVLRWFDIQGIERRAKTLSGGMEWILNSVIDQHMKMDKANQVHKESKNFIKFLLELMEQQDAKTQMTMPHLKALFIDIVGAGTDTTSTTVEWAMTEMMQHPQVMRKVQEELDEVVGMNNMVEESHLLKLHYVDAVVKETLRLHPPAPPVDSALSQFILHSWDPEAWDNPLDFRPERFLSDFKKYDYRGNDYNYLPFCSGRRICVGLTLGETMVKFVLACLLHSFDWRLPEGTSLDFTEKFGIVLKKWTPLVAIPNPRLLNLELYN